jgi:hypothetical protein
MEVGGDIDTQIVRIIRVAIFFVLEIFWPAMFVWFSLSLAWQ